MNKIKAINDLDQRLLEGIAASDSRQIRRVYDLVLPTIIWWVSENSGSETDARDVFQEALIALFQKLQKGDLVLTCTLKSFLQIICRNLWLARLRKHKKRELRPMLLEEEGEIDEELLLFLENAERNQLFFKHFDELEDKCRKILSWFFEKIPMATIAERLETSVNYIKKRKFVCKSKLITAIKKDPLFAELSDK